MLSELSNNCLAFDSLQSNFDDAQNQIKELENKLLDRDISFEEEKKKFKEIVNRMRTCLRSKDQGIIDLDKHINKMNQELDEA